MKYLYGCGGGEGYDRPRPCLSEADTKCVRTVRNHERTFTQP